MKHIKLPSIEICSDNFKPENDSSVKMNLKFLQPLKNSSFKNLQKVSDTEKKPIKIIKLRNSDLKEQLKRISSLSYLKPKERNNTKLNRVQTIKVTNNNLNNVINLDSNNNIDRNTRYSDKDSQTMLNSISSIMNNKNENKLILPTASKITIMKSEKEIKLSKSNIINKIDTNKNDKGIKIRNNIKYLFNNNSDKKDNNKFHEYDIKFHNSFYRNVNWNNNILKKILEEKNMKINLDIIKKCNYKKINDAKEKEKKKKNQHELKNINNKGYVNSYFNSDINNFYNKCKYKNNKLILTLMKKRNQNSGIKNYLSRFNDNNLYRNYCAYNIVNNEKQRNENKGNTLSFEHEYNYSSATSLRGNSILGLKNV